MLSKYKSTFEQAFAPVVRTLSGVNPNFLTFIGIIPQVLFFILMRSHHFGWAAIALIFSSIDMLDGMIARRYGKTSAFGAFLDSSIDRVSDFLLIAGFYVGGLVSLKLAAILLVTTYMISYIRSRAELAAAGRIRFDQGWIERPERIIYLFLVLVLQIIFPSKHIASPLIVILTILSLLTVVQRTWHAYKKL